MTVEKIPRSPTSLDQAVGLLERAVSEALRPGADPVSESRTALILDAVVAIAGHRGEDPEATLKRLTGATITTSW